MTMNTLLTRSEMKQEAKNALKGKWGTAILIFIILSAITTMISVIVPFLGSIVVWVVAPALYLGVAMTALRLIRSGEADIENLFDGFKQFGTAFVTNLLVGLIIFAWSLLGIIVAVVAAIFSATNISLALMMIPLYILLMIPGIIAYLSYSQVLFVLADNPEMSATDVLKASKAIMQGHRVELIVLYLSFFGWFFLSALTLGIGFLWSMPYFYVSTAVFYEQIKGTPTTVNNASLEF